MAHLITLMAVVLPVFAVFAVVLRSPRIHALVEELLCYLFEKL